MKLDSKGLSDSDTVSSYETGSGVRNASKMWVK